MTHIHFSIIFRMFEQVCFYGVQQNQRHKNFSSMKIHNFTLNSVSKNAEKSSSSIFLWPVNSCIATHHLNSMHVHFKVKKTILSSRFYYLLILFRVTLRSTKSVGFFL